MSDRRAPQGLHSAPYWYYTHIQMGSPDVVTVRRAAVDQQVSDHSPGTPVLRSADPVHATAEVRGNLSNRGNVANGTRSDVWGRFDQDRISRPRE
jgi:hypothetical protein